MKYLLSLIVFFSCCFTAVSQELKIASCNIEKIFEAHPEIQKLRKKHPKPLNKAAKIELEKELKPIRKKILQVIKQIAKEQSYEYVFDTSGNKVNQVNPRLIIDRINFTDITPEVSKRLTQKAK